VSKRSVRPERKGERRTKKPNNKVGLVFLIAQRVPAPSGLARFIAVHKDAGAKGTGRRAAENAGADLDWAHYSGHAIRAKLKGMARSRLITTIPTILPMPKHDIKQRMEVDDRLQNQ
jgi:hypothetical protein